jgi:hypothetical protein
MPKMRQIRLYGDCLALVPFTKSSASMFDRPLTILMQRGHSMAVGHAEVILAESGVADVVRMATQLFKLLRRRSVAERSEPEKLTHPSLDTRLMSGETDCSEGLGLLR